MLLLSNPSAWLRRLYSCLLVALLTLSLSLLYQRSKENDQLKNQQQYEPYQRLLPNLVFNLDVQYVERRKIIEEEESRLPIASPADFYDRLYRPSGHCKKLANMGGFGCLRRLDGNKIICLEEGILPSFNKCIVHSFGIGDDATFEEDIFNMLRCDMYLFDPTVLEKNVMLPGKQKPYWHFYKIGLSNVTAQRKVSDALDPTLEYQNFISYDTVQTFLGHKEKFIDIFKLDIDGDEWKVLSHMVRLGVLNYIRQIVVEIHAFDISLQPHHLWTPILQERYDVLMSLEKSGFRRVSAVNNTFLKSYITLPGTDTPRPSCMELLYVRF